MIIGCPPCKCDVLSTLHIHHPQVYQSLDQLEPNFVEMFIGWYSAKCMCFYFANRKFTTEIRGPKVSNGIFCFCM